VNNEPLVFAGTGPRTVVDRVTITWPTGAVQTERGLSAGRLHEIDERPLFTISPKSRHLVAGSAAPATVSVTPTDAEGKPRADAVVTFARKVGDGTLGVPLRHGDATEVTILPAADPGSMVLEISIDGVPVLVRPRLFWDPKNP
jgi:hypothetical protein